MIILRNLQSQMSDPFEIPTTVMPGVPTKRGALERSRPNVDEPIQVRLRVDRQVFPQTITLAAKGTHGDTSDPLPDAVALVPKVAEAIKARKLGVTQVPERAAPSPPAAAPEVAAPLTPAAPSAPVSTQGET